MEKDRADSREPQPSTGKKAVDSAGDRADGDWLHRMTALSQAIGNRNMIQLMKAASNAKQPIQRLVTIGGKLAKLDDKEQAYKELTDDQKNEVRKQHDDRKNVYGYPDQDAFYAHVKGQGGVPPVIKPVDQQELKKAKKIKNRLRFYQTHDKIGSPTDNKEFHREDHQDILPVFYPMSHTGMDEKTLRWTRNKEKKQYELFSSKKLTAPQKQELDEMSLSVTEEEGSGKMHWFANVGVNPVSSFTDTNIKSRPRGKRNSAYGGESLGDFTEGTTGKTGKRLTDREDHYKKKSKKKNKKKPQTTRGHQQAYMDTITKPKTKKRLLLGPKEVEEFVPNKKRKIRTTDEEQEKLPSGKRPSTMSPEQYDIGQHGRRTMIETPSRKNKGSYFEANKLTSDSGMTVGGMDIPGEKFYMKISEDRKTKEPYKFDQYTDVYNEKKQAKGWKNYFEQSKVDMNEVPQQSFYDSDEEMDYPDEAPRTPQFMPSYTETAVYTSPTELTLGSELGQPFQGHQDWVVQEEVSNTNMGFQYKLTRTDFA